MAMAFFLLAAAASAAVAGASWSPRPEGDLVTGLPGQPEVGFKHYAGYVDVGTGGDKALFYWFFEAEQEPEKKPLMLWLNGGPGCSSIAYGAAQELGPFLVRGYGANLTRNAYAWNKAVNLLFLEAPVGVGFSYTNKTADLGRLGDRVTAQDSYTFLLNWLAKFPEFKGRDFYIAGESYAGHYVPQLADLIYEGNKAAGRGSIINLKGFMIGNAVLNDETDQLGMVEYAWSHAIISDELHSAVTRECDSFKEEADGGRPGKGCSSAVRAFMGAFDDIDIYSIYTPTCLSPSAGSASAAPRSSRLVTAPRLFSQHRGDKQVERLAGDRTPRPEEAHGRRAARLGLQRRHGREGAGDVDAVQRQRDEAAGAGEERVAGVVLQAAGSWVGGGVRGGADAGDGARGGAPGAALRARPLARHALPLPPGPAPAGRRSTLAEVCLVHSSAQQSYEQVLHHWVVALYYACN
ncbi:serine carboxypeptidase-like 35 isoform X2 [Aegilops tauschii subsp. strangulata]|uniref:serine carboxypeptidase-like 35 isoform X2 n=1 Tax=Aegilops tauschii subsp. strangulata TaxID=200361 RepID=UPI00098AC3F4|nr:serine carboxypeptidase-like 35 isoform X2 [Aegilops tauschii subsp. strangulata]